MKSPKNELAQFFLSNAFCVTNRRALNNLTAYWLDEDVLLCT